MTGSLLVDEQPAIQSGYAWLVSEASPHSNSDSDRTCGTTNVLDDFDERVAARIVIVLNKQQRPFWSLRATGEVVLDVLEKNDLLDAVWPSVPLRDFVFRAHTIARQIVPGNAWHAL